MPSASFQPILDAALADYAKQIGIDPVKHPIVDQLRSCHSPDDVLKLLENKAKEFKDFRDGNRKLIDCLKPVVKVIHAFSGIIGEAVSFVSRIQHLLLRDFTSLLLSGSVPTSRGDIRWHRYSPHSTYLLAFSDYMASHDIWMLQVASNVSSSYDALVDLFECIGNFLKRLRIYTDLPLTPSMTDIIVKIMVELLSVLALATKQTKQGRFSR
jgi:hypothetical protein